MRRWRRSHSVRVRLTLWYVATMVVVLAVYAGAVFTFVSRSASEGLDQQIRRDFQWVAATIYQTPEGTFTWSAPEEIVAEEDQPWVQVWGAGRGALLFRSAEAQRRPVAESQALAGRVEPGIVTFPAEGGAIRILSRRGLIETGEGSAAREEEVVIQVGRSEAAMRQELRQLVLILVLGLPLGVAVAGLGGYTLARRALLPIERMTERALITAERLHERVPVDNPDDELGRLATVFNETLGRLEQSFDRMRRFTADVSHQLRTPLTAIRSVGEVGLGGHRDETAYRGIIGSMLEEVDRLASLVDRLLALSRSETGERRISKERVELPALGEEVAAHLGVLAEEKDQSIVVERLAPAVVHADGQGLRQALINLVDNAIKFSPPGGCVRIRVAESAGHAVVDVIDSGAGIAAADRPRIFDRFYRGSRGAEQAGAGLGLSIAKGAVEAEGGRLTLESSGDAGSTFRITLPAVSS